MEVGVIKGVIFHQGESDGVMIIGKEQYDKTYADMLNEWGLAEKMFPLLQEKCYKLAPTVEVKTEP